MGARVGSKASRGGREAGGRRRGGEEGGGGEEGSIDRRMTPDCFSGSHASVSG